MLEVANFPFCAAGGTCTTGKRYGGFANMKDVADQGCYVDEPPVTVKAVDNGCKVELTIGESNPVHGPRRPSQIGSEIPADDASGRCKLLEAQGMCNDNFGNETALLFGAYRGAAGPESYFDGSVPQSRMCFALGAC